MVKNQRTYVPERGDIVWLQFDPQTGHEQAGRRPALIISPQLYNKKVGLALMCPVTSKAKGYPFEVELPEKLKVSGVILADQVKSLDWQARGAEFACKAPSDIVYEVIAKLQTLIQ
jgi:mRNA interferase MazF